MKKNKYIQLDMFNHIEDPNRRQILFEIDKIMGRNINVFTTVPHSIEKLEYIRDFLRAYKKGGMAQVESESLEVGGQLFNLSEKHESILSELLSKSKAQPDRGTPSAKPANPKKT